MKRALSGDIEKKICQCFEKTDNYLKTCLCEKHGNYPILRCYKLDLAKENLLWIVVKELFSKYSINPLLIHTLFFFI